MIGKPALLLGLLLAASLLPVASAQADTVSYAGGHPIPAQQEGRFCYIEAPHTHTYSPSEDLSFLAHSGSIRTHFEFVGDPSSHGYEGPLIGYFGAHPHHFEGGSSSASACAIEGGHFHLRAPMDTSKFEEQDGTYYFGRYQDHVQLEPVVQARRPRARRVKRERRANRRAKKVPAPAPVAIAPKPKPKPVPKAKPKKTGFRSWMDRRRGH